MANNSLQSVDDVPQTQKRMPEKITEMINVVAGGDETGYIPRNVDVRMTRAQARILRDKLRALQDSGATTADGKFVDNRAQAVRWILENEVVL
jgi:hypothetical protein